MADLAVELYGVPVGVLSGAWRTFDFVPDPAAVTRFGIDSTILSVAIPLTVVAVRSRKARRQIFFRELLPEGRMLARLAQQATQVRIETTKGNQVADRTSVSSGGERS